MLRVTQPKNNFRSLNSSYLTIGYSVWLIILQFGRDRIRAIIILMISINFIEFVSILVQTVTF